MYGKGIRGLFIGKLSVLACWRESIAREGDGVKRNGLLSDLIALEGACMELDSYAWFV